MNYKKLIVILFYTLFSRSSFGSPEITTIENITQIMKAYKEQGFSHCACPVFPEKRRVGLIQELTEKICQLHPDKSKKLTLGFYGCGIGFADEVTTLITLKQCGFTSLTPYFIDPIFKEQEATKRTIKIMKFINTHPEINKGGYFTSAQEYIDTQEIPRIDIITAVDLGGKDVKLQDVLVGYIDICFDEKTIQKGITSLSYYYPMIEKLIKSRNKKKKKQDIKKAFENLSAIEF